MAGSSDPLERAAVVAQQTWLSSTREGLDRFREVVAAVARVLAEEGRPGPFPGIINPDQFDPAAGLEIRDLPEDLDFGAAPRGLDLPEPILDPEPPPAPDPGEAPEPGR